MDPSNNPTATQVPDLATAVNQVLGDLAFMLTDDDSQKDLSGLVWLEAKVAYEGPKTGELRCWCTRSFCTRLAANLLGIEPEDSEAVVGSADALREFMNVLCGQLTTLWYGTEEVYNLSIPDVDECIATPPIETFQGTHACRLSVEGEPLLLKHEQDVMP